MALEMDGEGGARAQKSLNIQAHPLPIALDMEEPKKVLIFIAHPFEWPSQWMGGGGEGTKCINFILFMPHILDFSRGPRKVSILCKGTI